MPSSDWVEMMDELDDLLMPREPAGVAECDAAWAATARVVRRRRWWRRGRTGLLILGGFVAGLLAMNRVSPPVNNRLTDQMVASANDRDEPAAAESYVDEGPRRLERWAESAEGEKRRVLFRRAGDGYLKRGDEIAAVRCYRHAIDGGSPPELAIRTEDSWLLMSLKLANKKE